MEDTTTTEEDAIPTSNNLPQEELDNKFVQIMLEIEKRYHGNGTTAHFKHEKIRIEQWVSVIMQSLNNLL